MGKLETSLNRKKFACSKFKMQLLFLLCFLTVQAKGFTIRLHGTWRFSHSVHSPDFVVDDKHITLSTSSSAIQCDYRPVREGIIECYGFRVLRHQGLVPPNLSHVKTFFKVARDGAILLLEQVEDDHVYLAWVSKEIQGKAVMERVYS